MHGGHDRQVIEDGGQRGGHDDLLVGHARELGHDEGARAHDRRHERATAGRGRLDAGGDLRLVADLLHERDREGPRRVAVGDRGAADRPVESRREHRDLGRPAAKAPGQEDGDVHEELADAGVQHERGEQDEDHQEVGRDSGERAEHALVGVKEEHLDQLRIAVRPRRLQKARHPRRDHQVRHEEQRGDEEPEAHRAARGFEHRDDQDGAENHLAGADRVHALPALGQLLRVADDVQARHRGQRDPRPVHERDAVLGRALAGGEEHERERDQEQEVDGAHLARFPRSRVRRPDVEQGGGGGPAAHRPAHDAGEPAHAATSAGRLPCTPSPRRGAAARWPGARRPWVRSP